MKAVLGRMLLALFIVFSIIALLKWAFGFHLGWPTFVSALLVPIILAALNAWTVRRERSSQQRS